MDVFEMLTRQLNDDDTLTQVGQSVGADPRQVQQVAQVGLPALMEGLRRNASTPEGAASLSRALEQHQDQEVGDLAGFLKNADTDDGAKILQHIFPGQAADVQMNLASQTGLDPSQVIGLLTRFAPLVLAMLGQQKKQANLNEDGVANLTSILSQVLGQSMSGDPSRSTGRAPDTSQGGGLMDILKNLLGMGR